MRIPILAALDRGEPTHSARARHYSLAELATVSDGEGVAKWGVAAGNTMLTYFEAEPTAFFREHRHISEQITLVLEGELVFEVGGRTIPVREGEVIAIPSDLPHAAYAGDGPVKAVDAWSPPIAKHLTVQ